jgi:hypothetical protein
MGSTCLDCGVYQFRSCVSKDGVNSLLFASLLFDDPRLVTVLNLFVLFDCFLGWVD